MGKVLKPCTYVGCNALIPLGQYRCALHPYAERKKQQKDYDVKRGNSNKRGYDRVWRDFAKAYLARNPECKKCLKDHPWRVLPAKHVDHIIPLEQRPDLKFVDSNLQGLCQPHHNRKTWEQSKGINRDRPNVSWDT
jgi:5-methylcytosine-specific restriction protein A